MRWLSWKWTSWMLGCALWITGCTHAPEPFFCVVTTAYDEHGVVQPESYQVNRACLIGLSARVRACYTAIK